MITHVTNFTKSYDQLKMKKMHITTVQTINKEKHKKYTIQPVFTLIWKAVSWQDIVITICIYTIFEGFPLTSMKNFKPVSVYEFNFLNLFEKLI